MSPKLLALIAIFYACGPALARDKTDEIHLLNGDRITGKVKKLEYGKLRFSTDSMGTLQIEWDDIATVSSEYEFEFELSDGQRYFGKLERGAQPSMLILSTETAPTILAFGQVVRITPIEDTFWDRLTGSLSVGYNFTKASEVSQFSFSAAATYRTRDRSVNVSASSIITHDQSNQTTERDDLNATLTHFRGNRWFNSWITGVERNDELGLDARLSLGGGFGRYLIQSNTSELSVIGGLIITREALLGDASTKENVEGLLGIGYSRYIYDDPNVNIATELQIYPNLTDRGRYRAQPDARIRYELVEDLFLDFTLYDSYDSDPPSGVAGSTNDYGVVTSLGWSF